MLHLTPSPHLRRLSHLPRPFWSVILPWQHNTAEVKKMWLRQVQITPQSLMASYVTLGKRCNSEYQHPPLKMEIQHLFTGVTMKIKWYVTIKHTAWCLVLNRYPTSRRVIIIISTVVWQLLIFTLDCVWMLIWILIYLARAPTSLLSSCHLRPPGEVKPGPHTGASPTLHPSSQPLSPQAPECGLVDFTAPNNTS